MNIDVITWTAILLKNSPGRNTAAVLEANFEIEANLYIRPVRLPLFNRKGISKFSF